MQADVPYAHCFLVFPTCTLLSGFPSMQRKHVAAVALKPRAFRWTPFQPVAQTSDASDTWSEQCDFVAAGLSLRHPSA